MATEGWVSGQLGLGPASMPTGIEVCSKAAMLDNDVRLKLWQHNQTFLLTEQLSHSRQEEPALLWKTGGADEGQVNGMTAPLVLFCCFSR